MKCTNKVIILGHRVVKDSGCEFGGVAKGSGTTLEAQSEMELSKRMKAAKRCRAVTRRDTCRHDTKAHPHSLRCLSSTGQTESSLEMYEVQLSRAKGRWVCESSYMGMTYALLLKLIPPWSPLISCQPSKQS